MKTQLIKIALYTLVLLAPLVTQASNAIHDHRHIKENHYLQDNYLSQQSDIKTTQILPSESAPEPSSLALISAGIIGLFFARRVRADKGLTPLTREVFHE